jgi:hypothetical protein
MLRTLFAIISAVFVVFEIAPPPSHTILRHRRGEKKGGGGVAPVCACTFCYQSDIRDPLIRTVD